MSLELTAVEKAALLASARESITSRLEARKPAWPPEADSAAERCGAFVTLREGPALRGCIGRMSSPDPLYRTVREMALAAAFEDPRFPPVARRELPSIRVEITALSPMERVADPSQIEVGRHGVHLSLGSRAGVFLPQVATEQGWGLDELLENLCYKAGLPGGSWRRPEALLQVFEGLVFGEGE